MLKWGRKVSHGNSDICFIPSCNKDVAVKILGGCKWKYSHFKNVRMFQHSPKKNTSDLFSWQEMLLCFEPVTAKVQSRA